MEKTYKYNVLTVTLYDEESGEMSTALFEYRYTAKDTMSRLKARISREVKQKYGEHVNLAGITSRRIRYDLYDMPSEYFRSHSQLKWSKLLTPEEVEQLEARKVHSKISVSRDTDVGDGGAESVPTV